MKRRALLAALMAGPAFAAPPAAELARIERLIGFIEMQKGVEFMRNGRAHSGADAARFLRGKFEKMGDGVNTAQQFIDQIASKSSTTGQPYLIKLADGRLLPAATVLGDELARIDAAR